MTTRTTRLALACPHAAAGEAGREAFADGGSAVDAALAACVTLTVVYPHMCSVGGDLIALLHAPDGTVTAVNASGAAPRALTRDIVLGDVERRRAAPTGHRAAGSRAATGPTRAGGPAAGPPARRPGAARIGPHGMPIGGPHTVTVPGALSGWAELHRLGGALEWARVLRPAAERAARGVTVSGGLAAMFAEATELVLDDPGLRSVFAPQGRLPVEGDLVRQPALAASLKILAHDGADVFYRGPLGAAFVAGLRAEGSLLTVDDLAAHAAELVAPLSLTAFGHEVLTAPPNSQGFVLLELLGTLERLDAGDAGRSGAGDTGATARTGALPPDPLGPRAGALAHLFRLASADRDQYLCDPRSHEVPLGELLDEPRLRRFAREAEQAAARGPGSGTATEHGGGGDAATRDGMTRRGDAAAGDTIACVAADSDGWAVCVIQSLYYGFGSGILEPATGIVAQNRGACFSLDAASPNLIVGGKRPLHTLMPVLVKRDGRLAVVPGTMGGEAQPQIHVQVLSRLLHGAAADEAVAAPRWIWDEGVVYAEADVPDACSEALQASGLTVVELGPLDESVGHAQCVCLEGDGRLEAGSDPRADGRAILAERPRRG